MESRQLGFQAVDPWTGSALSHEVSMRSSGFTCGLGDPGMDGMDQDFYENTGVPGSLLLESDGENHGIYHDISFFWKSKVQS